MWLKEVSLFFYLLFLWDQVILLKAGPLQRDVRAQGHLLVPWSTFCATYILQASNSIQSNLIIKPPTLVNPSSIERKRHF